MKPHARFLITSLTSFPKQIQGEADANQGERSKAVLSNHDVLGQVSKATKLKDCWIESRVRKDIYYFSSWGSQEGLKVAGAKGPSLWPTEPCQYPMAMGYDHFLCGSSCKGMVNTLHLFCSLSHLHWGLSWLPGTKEVLGRIVIIALCYQGWPQDPGILRWLSSDLGSHWGMRCFELCWPWSPCSRW